MLAVIKTGGKQYLIHTGQKLKVQKINAREGGPLPAGAASAREGGKVIFDQVLLVSDDQKTEIGTPMVKSAKVEARVLKQGRAKKVIVFKYHSKTRYRKKRGHRQHFTEVEITKISA